MVTEAAVLDALRHVDDPDLKKDLVTLNMIKNIVIETGRVSFDVELTTPACPLKDMIRNACVNAVHHFVDKSLEVAPNMTSRVTSNRQEKAVLPEVRNVIAVASGKGGVGKSTVAVNLARSLARTGAKVGLLDADIYGPSIPTMMGLKGSRPESSEGKMVPVEKDGIKVISIGFLVEDNQAIIWRGPMASSAINQFTTDVDWGELDYLIMDLPPGTGDIHLTIAQKVPLTGAVVVTTPQEVAAADCRKAIGMFNNQHIQVPVLGIVENMAWFTPDDDKSKRYYLFGKDGGRKIAQQFDLPLLSQIPLVERIMSSADSGEPLTEHVAVQLAYDQLAGEVARYVAIRNSAAV
ncbi:MAG: Mrp/NBP35 family ATP-binding protein [Flavobacteriales bacterium]|nr:Mrp/NBP35 family ATP-binding protein [Bacteroidota bacterium]MCB9240703.1 Mrp/NBP35 family ATP-binding protein [Flavobacteriales bacterium]